MNNPQGNSSIQENLSLAIFRIFRSVARFALRYGMSTGAMTELLRRASIEAAQDLLRQDKSKVTTARVCAMTGLYPKEIRRIERLPSISATPTDDKYNRSARVVSGWRRDPDFLTKAGKPATLKYEGENGFDALVRKYSGDMTPAAMKEELERLGLLTVTSRNLIKLESKAYISSWDSDVIQMLGTDTADLINTFDHNIQSDQDSKLFQRKVAYQNIPRQHVDEFLIFAGQESQLVLERLDKWLARHDDDDYAPDSSGVRIGVGIYHFRHDTLPTNKNHTDDTDQGL
jgi:hypothetical protein